MDIKSLITSSTDAEKVSLTIKSVLAFAVLFGIDSTVAADAAEPITNTILALGMLFSALSTLWGLSRKVALGRWSA